MVVRAPVATLDTPDHTLQLSFDKQIECFSNLLLVDFLRDLNTFNRLNCA